MNAVWEFSMRSEGKGLKVHQVPFIVPCMKLNMQVTGIKRRNHTFMAANHFWEEVLCSPVSCPITWIVQPTARRIKPTATERGVCFSIQIIMAIISPAKLIAVPTVEYILASRLSARDKSGLGSIPFNQNSRLAG